MKNIITNSNKQVVNNRVADEAIYQTLDYYDNPKEYFCSTLNEIERELGEPTSLLDVGCSNGAFLYHTQKRFCSTELKGIDPIQSLVNLARENLNNVNIFNLNILDEALVEVTGVSMAVTMMGVMYLFRDPERVIRNLLGLVSKGGAVFIFSSFNEEPVDVLVNYRRAPKGE